MAGLALVELSDLLLLDYLPFSRVVAVFARHSAADRTITPGSFKAALHELLEVTVKLISKLNKGEVSVEAELERAKKQVDTLAPSVYSIFDVDSDGKVTGTELAAGLCAMCAGEPLDKAQCLFRLYDADKSGTITPEEMTSFLKAIIATQRAVAPPAGDEGAAPLPPIDEIAAATTEACFKDADTNGDGCLTLDEFVGWYLGTATATLD